MSIATERRRFLACLSDPSRFSLVTVLAGGPRCVTELATLVGLSQSCTTRHLQALLRESIVVAERRGKRVEYALRREGQGIHPVLRWACESADAPDGRPSPPSRSRRRVAESLALEPERAMTVAVEHESGWVAADVPLAAPREHRFEAPPEPDHDAEVTTTPGDGSRRARPEMDDFLL